MDNMTDARAAAVEAAEDAFYQAVGLEAAGRSVAGKRAFGIAVDAYLARIAKAGWVMVPMDAVRKVVDRFGPRGGHLPLSEDIEALAAACRAAMLGSVDTTTPIADALG